jgi:sarcosine oxidase gamma subunit
VTDDRRSPLHGWADRLAAVGSDSRGQVKLAELSFRTQVNIRAADPAAAEVALGFPVPTTPNTLVVDGAATVLWLGPDEWLVVAPPGTFVAGVGRTAPGKTASGHDGAGATGLDPAGATGLIAAGTDGHGAAGTDGHGAAGTDGHGAAGADGHGAAGADGHGAARADGHGAARAGGHGAARAGGPSAARSDDSPADGLTAGDPAGPDAVGAGVPDAAGSGWSAVDVSTNRTVITVTGPVAADLLAHGCALDFGRPAPWCAQTMVAQAQVILVHPRPAEYHLLVRGSFARYLAAWLIDAATEWTAHPVRR